MVRASGSARATERGLTEDVGQADAVDGGELAELGERRIPLAALDPRKTARVRPDLRRDFVELQAAQVSDCPEPLADFGT